MDFKTATLIFGTVYTLLPIFTWFVLAKERRSADVLWCGGGFISGLGILLGGFREHDVSLFITLTIPNVTVFAGTLLKLQALRSTLNKPWPSNLIPLLIGIFVVAYELIRQFFGMGLAILLISGGVTYPLMSFLLAHYARQIGQKKKITSAFWLANAYFFLTLTLLIRLAYVLMTGDGLIEKTPHFTANLISVAGTLTTILSSIGYIGMRLEQANQDLLQSRLEQTALVNAQVLTDKLGHVQRKETVDQIAAMMGHELKQPLGAIKLDATFGLAQIKSNLLQNTTLEDVFSRIDKNVTRAESLVNRLTTMSKTRERLAFSLDLHAVALSSMELLAAYAKKQNVIVSMSERSTNVLAYADELETSQILVNLLKNAIESFNSNSAHRKQVSVWCGLEDGYASIRITDNGPGFDDEGFKNLGTSFYSTKHEGLGLGIAISRGLVERNGGKIKIRNNQPHGVVVELWLPQPTHA